MKLNSQPSTHSSLLPMGNPKKIDYSHNFTIFDPVQLFLQDTWQVQNFHNTGRDEIYENKFSTPFPCVPLVPG